MSQLHLPATPSRLRALRVAGVLDEVTFHQAMAKIDRRPDVASWRRWSGVYLATLGACLVGSGVIFFFAANWQAMGHWTRFGLAAALFASAAGTAWRLGNDAMGGRALALLAGILVGPLFAVYGQEWQTGADPWQLFAAWAVFLAGFAFVSKLDVAWAIWLVIAHVAVLLFARLALEAPLSGLASLPVRLGLVALDLAVLVVALRQDRGPLLPRFAALLCVAILGVPSFAFVMGEGASHGVDFTVLSALVVATFVVFREQRPDLFLLAVAGSVIAIVVGTLVGRALFSGRSDIGTVFLFGLVVLGEAFALARWLRWEHRRLNESGEELR